MKEEISIVLMGGLANRMLSIASSSHFAVENEKKIKLIWFCDKTLNCKFQDIFTFPEYKNVEIIDAKWKDYLLYERPRQRNLYITKIIQSFFFDKRIYLKDFASFEPKNQFLQSLNANNNIYTVAYCAIDKNIEWLKKIKLLPFLKQSVEEKIDLFAKNTIGIHIRRTDLPNSTENSPLELFISAIQKEIEEDSSVKFYVASDSLDEKITLKNLFGDRIISSYKETRRDSKNGIYEAVIELYVLSRTRKILGTATSTFSAVAAYLGGIDCTVITKNAQYESII
jgi:hypothetical protein